MPARFGVAAMGSSPAFIIAENCEGTGTPAGWVNASGSPNWDYTTVPLEGAQSLYIASNGAFVRVRTADFTSIPEVWVYALVRFTNGTGPASGTPSFIGLAAATVGAPTVTITMDTTLHLLAGTAPSATVTAVTVDTTYHIWYHFKKGTGSNAIQDVAFSTTGIRPTSGNNFSQITNGATIADMGRLFLGSAGTLLGLDIIWDKIRVAASQIGDNGVL